MKRRSKKGRRRGRRRSTAHLKKYQFKKKRRKGRHTMARRKKKRGASRRRSHGRRRSHRRSRRSFSGGGYGLKPSGDDVKMLIASGAWGFAERNAKTDASSFLNKVPKPVDQLGFTGNSALILWLLSVITKNHYVRVGARAVANIAAYQLGHKGTTFTQGGEHFAIQGWDDDDVAEAIEAHVSGLNPYGQESGF